MYGIYSVRFKIMAINSNTDTRTMEGLALRAVKLHA
jgi:hypothetical protein